MSLGSPGSPKPNGFRLKSMADRGGASPALVNRIAELDKNGDGTIDLEELSHAVEDITHQKAQLKMYRWAVIMLTTFLILIIGANFGLGFAVVKLTKDTEVGSSGALVDKDTGATIRTASGIVPVSYSLLDASQDPRTNITTIRYTIPRSAVQLGCILVTEGHTTLPADLVGPPEVFGTSSRPRRYDVIDKSGCTEGRLSGAIEATLQATPIMSDDSTLYFIYISCPAPTPTSTAPECSATQWWLNEVSLPYVNNTLLSPVTTAAGRKLLASGSVSPVTAPGEPFVDQFVLSMVRGSGVHNPGRVSLARTAAIWDAPDGQVSTGDKSDATSGRSLLNTPTSMTKRRLLAEELTATADASSHGRGRTLLDKNNICTTYKCGVCCTYDTKYCCWNGRRLGEGSELSNPASMLELGAARAYVDMSDPQQVAAFLTLHRFADQDAVDPTIMSQYNCIICTFLNWRGLLADDVARGDLAFGNLLLKHVPFVHRGYFLYAKWVVRWMARSERYMNLVAPIARDWAEQVSWMTGYTRTFNLRGSVMLLTGFPVTGILGLMVPYVPAPIMEALGLAVLAWFHVLGLGRLVGCWLGAGWLGLLAPIAAAAAMWRWRSAKAAATTTTTSTSTITKDGSKNGAVTSKVVA